MPNPVRIYVLHHPDSDAARDLTHEIYHWFRLPSMDELPVYVRSKPASEARRSKKSPTNWPQLQKVLPGLHRVSTTLLSGCHRAVQEGTVFHGA
jgi:hypothetical protein